MTALFIGLLAAFIIGFLANSYWIENIVHLALYAEKYIAL